jgi:hypothetical protein
MVSLVHALLVTMALAATPVQAQEVPQSIIPAVAWCEKLEHAELYVRLWEKQGIELARKFMFDNDSTCYSALLMENVQPRFVVPLEQIGGLHDVVDAQGRPRKLTLWRVGGSEGEVYSWGLSPVADPGKGA